MVRTMLAAGCLLLVLAGTARSDDWADEMFEVKSHDFGPIARGAKIEYEFVVTNIFQGDVHIADVYSSCGCTIPRISKPLLKSYEKGSIVALANTTNFSGNRGATLTVKFDQPRYAVVYLNVRMNIQSDVVFDPPSVKFGTLEQGREATAKIRVTRSGWSEWRITQARSGNPAVRATAKEVSREYGSVAYDLSVRLDRAQPAGYLNEHLVLVTNDSSTPEIPVTVEGNVLSPITVNPAELFLGVVEQGQKVTRQLVVQAKRPMRITAIEADRTSFDFHLPADQPAKMVHIIPITFTAGCDLGKVVKSIRVKTDLQGAVGQVSLYAVVNP